ncbi:MAG: 3-dehydroquinate synthase [Deltaproteobacteria bacterium]|nr:3-dehydroquinate synthase [Deltaproteobacteria bacterium]
MKTIRVPFGSRSYTITIGRGAVRDLPRGLKKHLPSGRFVVLTNRTIARLYRSRIERILKRTKPLAWIVIPDGERHKNLKTVAGIYDRLVKVQADRKTGLVALGGGVVGDIGGFVAATWLRGIPYIQVPTTLLAQVDSSVGGKTGVDLRSGKNLVGAFYQPAWVLIDTDFLKILPRREFLCGLAEVVKYGVIRDKQFFGYLEKNIGKILNLDHNALERIIGRSLKIKAEIVSKDERERGLRSLLNFGHTLGHAVETLSGYRKIRHGEAVSRGMVYSAILSYERGLCPMAEVSRLYNLLRKTGLPVRWPAYSKKAYARVMAADKKGVGKKIRYIGIRGIGRAAVLPLTAWEILRYL